MRDFNRLLRPDDFDWKNLSPVKILKSRIIRETGENEDFIILLERRMKLSPCRCVLGGGCDLKYIGDDREIRTYDSKKDFQRVILFVEVGEEDEKTFWKILRTQDKEAVYMKILKKGAMFGKGTTLWFKPIPNPKPFLMKTHNHPNSFGYHTGKREFHSTALM